MIAHASLPSFSKDKEISGGKKLAHLLPFPSDASRSDSPRIMVGLFTSRLTCSRAILSNLDMPFDSHTTRLASITATLLV